MEIACSKELAEYFHVSTDFEPSADRFQHSPASGKSQLMPPCASGRYLQFEVTKATLSRICFQTSRTTVYDSLGFQTCSNVQSIIIYPISNSANGSQLLISPIQIATRSWFRSLDQNLSLSPVQPFLVDVSAENIALQLTENMTLLETQGRTSKVWPATTTKTKSAKCRRKSSISQLTAESSHLVMVNYSILLVYDPVLTGPHTFHTRSKKFNALNVVLPWHRFREAELLAARLGSSFHSSTQTRNGQQMPR